MKDRTRKQQDLEALKQALAGSPNVFVTSFNKLTVAQDFELRKAVRGAGGVYRVVKNTLAEKAAAGAAAEGVLKGLKGTSAVAYTSGDPVMLAKTLTRYARENPAFTFKAGIVEGRVIDLKAIEDLANLPPKEAIFAKLLFLLNAPAQRLVSAISGAGRNLAVVIDQAVKENKFSA